MKSPEYVATVTKIYRKYIDLAMSNEPYIIDSNDKKELLQVFNRGMFSSGHFSLCLLLPARLQKTPPGFARPIQFSL